MQRTNRPVTSKKKTTAKAEKPEKAVKPSKTVKQEKPVKAEKLAKVAKPAKAAKPVKAAKAVKPIKAKTPVESEKPDQPAESHVSAKPAETSVAVKVDYPVETIKPVKQPEPLKTIEPVEQTKKTEKPVEPVKPEKQPEPSKAPAKTETKAGKLPRLKDKYLKEAVPSLVKEYSYKNVMQVPKVEKVVLNVGLGEAIQNIKLLEAAQKELSTITGQRAVITKAKKSIASFKLRKGVPIGCKVTLRGNRMYEFLDRFINLALPRVRDFRGVSGKAFDGRGNYSIGIKEQFIFPEVEYDKVETVHGMDITICTNAKTDKESKSLLRYLGMPFRK